MRERNPSNFKILILIKVFGAILFARFSWKDEDFFLKTHWSMDLKVLFVKNERAASTLLIKNFLSTLNISKKILETKINTKVDVIRILIQVYLLKRLLNLWKIEMYKNMQSVNYVQNDSTKWSSYYYYLKDETDIIRYNLTSLVVIHKTSTV